jgi:putative hydrolase of the HAD superfamily
MIEAVLFDLYETLITESGLRPTRASSLAASLGLDDGAYRTEWKARRPRITRGQISLAQALAEISETLSGRPDASTLNGICEGRLQEKAQAYAHVHREVIAMVTGLASRGIRLAVVSNGFQEDVAGWSHYSLAPYFQCTAFSCVERVAKPDPEIYLRTVRRLGSVPARTAYIGDGGDDELGGAERVGLQAGRAVWFVRNDSLAGTWPELATANDVMKFVGAN